MIDFLADAVQTSGQRTGISIGNFGDDGEWLLFEVVLLHEQALCGWQMVDGLNEQLYALVIIGVQHAVDLVIRDGL